MDPVLAGRYELDVLLGRGGSGEVWRAKDMATGQLVAIKLVELSLINDPSELSETVARFRREAQVVEALKHPNIVGTIDAGRVGGQLFMVMELAPGVSLASISASGVDAEITSAATGPSIFGIARSSA